MIGWRAKFGVMVPCRNTTLEPEFYKLAPEGVTFHFDRLGLAPGGEGETPEEVNKRLRRDGEEAVVCAGNFSKMMLDAIAFGCTTGSLIGGPDYDQQLISKLKEITSIPITTTSTAVIEALKHLEIKKVVVVTPYIPEINEKEKIFLEAHDIEVIRIERIPYFTLKSEIVPQRVYQLAREIDTPMAHGIFISCTGLRSIEIIESLEQDTGKPVISSNQATFWKLLKMAGLHPFIKGHGRLLEEF